MSAGPKASLQIALVHPRPRPLLADIGVGLGTGWLALHFGHGSAF